MSRSVTFAVGLLVVLVCCPAALVAQPALAGRWEGAIRLDRPPPLGIIVTFTGDAASLAATIDIPQQNARAIPLRSVRAEGGKVHFELPAGPGLATFDGAVSGDQVSGTFEQAGVKGTFDLKRAAPVAPEPPPPYRAEEVKIPVGAVTLAGTLTLPPSGGPHPAVVLITGSGPQNRDEELFGFRPFKVIADHLTRAGIAVLRCDDRGVGGSTGGTSHATSLDFADDALAEVQFLKARADIDKAHIGLIGHSEGGLIAPLVATRSSDVAFIVMLSGPALTGERIMLAQAEQIARAENIPEEQIRANADLQRKMFAAVRSGTGWEAVAEAGIALTRTALARLPEAQRKAMGDPEVVARRQMEAQIAAVQSPWFKFFLDYDPAPALGRVTVPVLAIFGERDLQVPAASNRDVVAPIFARRGNRSSRIEVVPRANHLYQDAVTGSASEYATLPKAFVPGFLDLVATWIQQVVRK